MYTYMWLLFTQHFIFMSFKLTILIQSKPKEELTMANPNEITLRRFELTDVGDILQWTGDERVTKYLRCNTFVSKEEAVEFFERVILPHPWYRAVCVGGRPVGYVSVLPGSGKDERKAEISYALKVAVWGMGIATQAVRMAVRKASEELAFLDRIEGLVLVENEASQRVLEKAGFLREGVLRKFFFVKGESKDIVVFSVVKGEF